MLVLSRKKGQRVLISDRIAVQLVDIRGDKCRIGFEAPRDVTIWREELSAPQASTTALYGSYVLEEGQRQMLLLAAGRLAHERPGWLEALGEIADVLGGRRIFESFHEMAVEENTVIDFSKPAMVIPVTQGESS